MDAKAGMVPGFVNNIEIWSMYSAMSLNNIEIRPMYSAMSLKLISTLSVGPLHPYKDRN